jgi:hypothetical protein
MDECSSSKINGIGTYLQELTHCLKKMNINLYFIACYHNSDIFKIEIKDGIKQMQFPSIPDFCSNHYNIIDKFLRLYIKDSRDNIFLFNHGPYEFLLKTVKKSFPLSKIIFVIHDMSWTDFMLGDKTELNKCV